MNEFTSLSDYYNFAEFIRTEARHILDKKNRLFIDVVLTTAQTRAIIGDKGIHFWRAQLAHDLRTEQIPDHDGRVIDEMEMECPADATRMVPRWDRANEGRVNPKGIPCLYLATDKETAMSEVRPWIGSLVSVGLFAAQRNLRLVNCCIDDKPPRMSMRALVSPQHREKLVWQQINRAFAEPVTRSDDVAEYAPTQVLAEAFRAAGFDGLMYSSNFGQGSGRNIALFHLSAAVLVYCELCKVESLKFQFSNSRDAYCMPEHSSVKPTNVRFFDMDLKYEKQQEGK
jgi:hypothetical protein